MAVPAAKTCDVNVFWHLTSCLEIVDVQYLEIRRCFKQSYYDVIWHDHNLHVVPPLTWRFLACLQFEVFKIPAVPSTLSPACPTLANQVHYFRENPCKGYSLHSLIRVRMGDFTHHKRFGGFTLYKREPQGHKNFFFHWGICKREHAKKSPKGFSNATSSWLCSQTCFEPRMTPQAKFWHNHRTFSSLCTEVFNFHLPISWAANGISSYKNIGVK